MKKSMRLWIQALESGRYKQGRSRLHLSDGSYCCLGVACEVYRKANGTRTLPRRMSNDRECYYYGYESLDLPTVVQTWLGVPAGDPWHLAHKNDSGWSFPKIAKFLRDKVKT